MEIAPIETERLLLQAVLPSEYEILAVDRADARLWVDRGFANPFGHLVEDAGPLPYRIPRIRTNPELAPYLLRLAVLKQTNSIIGSSGFHAEPDNHGMIEVGMGIEPAFRGRGFAQEMLQGMWGWVINQPGVRTLRYTVTPNNAPSQAIIKKFGFHFVGQQMDDEDGPEDIYEMKVSEYREKYATDLR
jgi:RimJ/RimL family protein N-acetyltransferase